MYHATISSFNKPERLDSKLQREANNLLSILKEYYVLLLHKQHGSNISLIHTLARCIESLLVIGCMVSSFALTVGSDATVHVFTARIGDWWPAKLKNVIRVSDNRNGGHSRRRLSHV